ncbi:MAG: sigma-70 family RNA polymerase sigma factor [Rhodospirillales bacterium]|nr:sigma-70 family RNA polymerase sigma factor [Acetobacter sp.]
MQPCSGSEGGPDGRFEPTHWSVVLAASREVDAGDAAQVALAQLCRTYWSPLYGFIRGRGHSVHDAQDLTQGFFCHLIEHRLYAHADRTVGKFRSFLLASLKHFLADAYDREHALKRGGACEFLPLHEEQVTAAEAMFQGSTAPGVFAPEDHVFERHWAETLVAAALGRLAAEWATDGKTALFETLEVFVRGSAESPPSYDELARRLKMPAVTVRSHVNRLRARYRVLVRAELRRTVGSEEAVDEELHELLRVLTTK